MSDIDREFSPSPSPDEDWGSDPEQEWPVSGIVGESTDAFDNKRYEVKWEGWTRKDGTNTTWDKPREDLEELIEAWNEKQGRKRAVRADASPAIQIGVQEWQMLHEDRTVELARGYEELRRKYLQDPRVRTWAHGGGRDASVRRAVDFDGMLKPLRPPAEGRQDGDAAPTGAGGAGDDKARTRTTVASGRTSSSRSAPVSRDASNTPVSASRETSGSTSTSTSTPPPSSGIAASRYRPIKPLPRRAIARIVSSPAPDSEEEEGPRDPAPARAPPRELKRRRVVEHKWARRLDGAAPVKFVNDVNFEEVPPAIENFDYLERRYTRAKDVPSNESILECMVSCDCDERCLDATHCECQDPSELEDDHGHKIFAYTRKRLFNFELPPGTEVIECNENCSCDDRCPNRVAQRPRDVPIEVFRTRSCGWGARATMALPRGKVVGIYTGQLIRREEADRCQDARRSYIFDLDVRELGEDDDDGMEKYSVDGYAQGNWTRFVNHSCEPNMRVVPVIWDTIPELNQPYLAFVATENIPARTELTIDYDPKAGQEARKGKTKTRQKTPDGARECLCGSENCRGWVRV